MQIKKSYLTLNILLVLMMCVALVFGCTIMILACLAGFLLLVGWCCSQNYTLPILLFFLPWSPVLRTSPLGYSFFTFGLILVCGISIIKKRFKFRKYPIVAGVLLLFLTLVSKVIDGSGLTMDYILFIMLIFLFPVVKGEWTLKKYDFYHVVVFFSLGVIIAAICALNLTIFPNIARYIRVDAYATITRRSGFYGDANFYTAQITAAMGGCLLMILQEKKPSRLVTIVILLLLLLYSGFLSGSKSFVLVAVFTVFLWLIALMRKPGRVGLKVGAFSGVALIVIVIATSSLFGDLLEVVLTRFSYSKDMESFTTGRTSLWSMYLKEIISDAKVFFLGKGFTNVKLEGRGSHNTLIQAFFQFGFIGVPVLIYWIVSFFRGSSLRGRRKKIAGFEAMMIVVATLIPWIALDALFFDEFFLLQWYVFCALQQLRSTNVTQLEDQYGRTN